MQVEVAFANPLGDVPAVEVTYALLDSGGVRFYTGSESFDIAAADEAFRVQSDTVEPLPASVDGTGVTCQVLAVEEGFSFGTPTPPSPSDACQFVEIDDFGDIQIELAVTSPFSETENLQIYYALRGPEGVRFDDSSASVDLVAAGEAVRLSEDTVTNPPDWVQPESITCSILAIEASEF